MLFYNILNKNKRHIYFFICVESHVKVKFFLEKNRFFFLSDWISSKLRNRKKIVESKLNAIESTLELQ